MTTISRDDVARLATMSSLDLSDDELDEFTNEFERIIHYVEQLNELDTENITPTYQVHQQQNVWRDDTLEDSLRTDALLSIAPEQSNSQIKVPKVL